MPTENARDKGKRLLAEGRLTVTQVGPDKYGQDVIAATVKGDSGEVYTLGYHKRTGWLCRCPARGICSHLRALQLVTVKPTGGT